MSTIVISHGTTNFYSIEITNIFWIYGCEVKLCILNIFLMKMESCIKIGKPIQTLFDKDKKNSDKFLCHKICEAKLSFLISILFFFDRKNILSST